MITEVEKVERLPPDETRVVLRVASEPVSWPELVSIVRRCMRSVAGPSPDLEDLTQTALERVVRSLGAEPRFEARAKLSTFAYRVCAGVATNHWRWWRRWVRRFDLGTDSAAEPADDPRAFDAERARSIRLHQLLERMAPAKRLVLTLCDLEELPASQVAEILECPEPTVRSRLRQARLELSERVQRDPWFRAELTEVPGLREPSNAITAPRRSLQPRLRR